MSELDFFLAILRSAGVGLSADEDEWGFVGVVGVEVSDTRMSGADGEDRLAGAGPARSAGGGRCVLAESIALALRWRDEEEEEIQWRCKVEDRWTDAC